MAVVAEAKSKTVTRGRGTSAGGSGRTSRTKKSLPKVSVEPHRVAAVHGNDDYLVGRGVARLKDAMLASHPEVEVTDLDATDLTAGSLNEAVSPSLFGGERLVVIRVMRTADEDAAKAVLAVADDLPEGLRMIVADTEPGGARRGGAGGGGAGAEASDGGSAGSRGSAAARAVVPALVAGGAHDVVCDGPATARDRVAFVRNEVAAAGATVSADAAALLVDVVGSDTRELASASGQLVADLCEPGERRALQAEDVERFHRGRAEVSGFAIADLALAGDRDSALEALRRAAVLGVHPLLVADALASGLRSLARVAAATGDAPVGPRDAERIGRELRVPGWKVKRLAGEARQWSTSGLVTASQRVSALNAALKGAGTVADEQYALERAVFDLASARESRAESSG